MKKYFIFAVTLVLAFTMATTAFAAQDANYTLEFEEDVAYVANWFAVYEYKPVYAHVYDAQGDIVEEVTITYTLVPMGAQNTTGDFCDDDISLDDFWDDLWLGECKVIATATVGGEALHAEIPLFLMHIFPK